jgi:hypothetical protein
LLVEEPERNGKLTKVVVDECLGHNGSMATKAMASI